MRRRGEREIRIVGIVSVLCCSLLFIGCAPNPAIMKSGKSEPTPLPVTGERPVSDFEKDLEAMRTANFEFIYALRRKDGGKLDAEDKKFIRANSPDTNRNILTDDDKALISGSNFPLAPERLKALQDRFDFKDYSEVPMPVSDSNGNANVKK
jgi:hypothetical protein